MLRLTRFAPALLGLALVSPASVRAQSHAHAPSPHDCDACLAARHGSPVVQERRGLIGRLRGNDRVSIPTGHHVDHRGQRIQPQAADPSWNGASAGGAPSLVAEYYGHDADTGFASIGPNDAAPPIPNASLASGEPLPIGEMRTSFVAPTPHAAPMPPVAPNGTLPNASAMNGGFSGVPVIPPDPSIQMWHQSGLADRAGSRRSGPMETMLGISSLSNWMEQRRTIRAMRASAKQGVYAPSMHEMPAWAVNGR